MDKIDVILILASGFIIFTLEKKSVTNLSRRVLQALVAAGRAVGLI